MILSKIFQNGETGDWINVDSVLDYMLIVEPLAQFTSMIIVHKVPRKTMIVIYALSLAVLNCFLAFFDIANSNLGVVLAMLSMVFIQDCFGIPVMGLYAVEVTNNSTLGVL